MKLRMAENSLFAILLRSPWWISFAVAGVLTLGALAVLPAPYKAYAVSAGLPFIVIGFIAVYRQARQPSKARMAATDAALRGMSWREFSVVVEQALRQRGYEVDRLSTGGADFEVTRGAQRGVVSCKRWKAAHHGLDALRELDAVAHTRAAQERIYIALNPLSDNAQRYARENRIDVIRDAALVQMLTPALRK